MKNIILCSDGTWNQGGVGRPTNVWRLYQEILPGDDGAGVTQIAAYDDGVGTSKLRPRQLLGGAFGFGLNKNIRDLYEFLVRHYEKDDRIFLFGFSRGAFTVRSLSGLIGLCGVARWQDYKELSDDPVGRAANEAFAAYRRDHITKRRVKQVAALKRGWFDRTLRPLRAEKESHAFAFRRDRAHSGTIECLGVWDTVSALGGPFDAMRWAVDQVLYVEFHDHKLSPHVNHSFQALALDEERASFRPKVWKTPGDGSPHCEQVWFAGAHSNVGGGYPRQGLAAPSLVWMMDRAKFCGLSLRDGALTRARDTWDVQDRLYDSRGGVSQFYRWRPRDVAALRQESGAGEVCIHRSVVDRIVGSMGAYAPGNLPEKCTVVSTPHDPPVSDDVHHLVAQIESSDEDTDPPLRRVTRQRCAYRAVYWAVLLLVAAVVIALILTPDGLETEGSRSPLAGPVAAAWTAAEWVSPIDFLDDIVRRTRPLVIDGWAAVYLVLGALVALLWLGARMKRAMHRVFEDHWAHRMLCVDVRSIAQLEGGGDETA